MAAAGAGHTSAEARRLLEELGPNEIQREKGRSPARMFLQQLRSPMIALLAAAVTASGQ